MRKRGPGGRGCVPFKRRQYRITLVRLVLDCTPQQTAAINANSEHGCEEANKHVVSATRYAVVEPYACMRARVRGGVQRDQAGDGGSRGVRTSTRKGRRGMGERAMDAVYGGSTSTCLQW